MSSGFQPSGEDRATGIGGLPGTPTPAGTIVGLPSVVFQEDSTSPIIEAAEQGTIVKEFTVDATTGLSIVNSVNRGTILVDNNGIVTRVLSTRFQQKKPNLATITMTSEALSVVPPEEFRVEAVEFNPSLFRHPRYQSVVNYVGGAGQYNGAQICSIIQGATNLPQLSSQSEAQSQLTPAQISDSTVLGLAQELFGLFQQGFDTFYLAGFKVTWCQFAFNPILMNPGGYIQDPVSQGGLPPHFWSTTQTTGGANILTALAATVAPRLYSGGLSWLRQSDDLEYQRTWFKITRIWLGAPLGHWSPIIYGSGA